MAKRKGGEASAVGDLLRGFIEHHENEVMGPRQRAQRAWETVATQKGLTATRFAGFRERMLTIEVSSPPLCAELAQFRQQELLEAFRRELSDDDLVQKIRFRLGAFPGDRRRNEEGG